MIPAQRIRSLWDKVSIRISLIPEKIAAITNEFYLTIGISFGARKAYPSGEGSNTGPETRLDFE
jgi:hypothetical protein